MKVIKESKCYMEVLIIPETVITALQIHGLKSIDLLSLKIKLQYSNILIPNWLKCLLKINFSSFWEAYLWIFSISFCRYSNNSNNLSFIFYTSKCIFIQQIPLFHHRYCWVTVKDNLVTCVGQGRGIYFPHFSLFCFLRVLQDLPVFWGWAADLILWLCFVFLSMSTLSGGNNQCRLYPSGMVSTLAAVLTHLQDLVSVCSFVRMRPDNDFLP